MSVWTADQILQDAQDKGIEFIRLLFTDILGTIKNVEIPIARLEKALNGRITFDGSAIEGFVRLEETDMYLVPDLSTWFVQTDYKHPSQQIGHMMCDIYTMDRKPYSGDPRGNLKRILKRMDAMGFDSFNIGPEPEFFLFRLDHEGKPTLVGDDEGGYYDLITENAAELCRREIVSELEKIGFEIEVSHHEVGMSQHEIDWNYTDALTACDRLQVFKLTVKAIAAQHGLYATFMPKPINGIAGSGMHVNLSLFKDGDNAFCDEESDRGLSPTAYQFLAGLLAFAPAYTAVCNPLVNSYKRLVDGFEAPLYIGWSEKNRSPFARIPAARGLSTRIELRSIDPSANPYLAIATILQAGLEGISAKMKPSKQITRNVYVMTREERYARGIYDLPHDLGEAIDALEKSAVILDALGPEIADSYTAGKRLEYESYQRYVSQWEIDRYFRNY